MPNSGVDTESRTEPFIWIIWVDHSNSIYHDQVLVLSYSKYSLLVLPVAGIEPSTFRWFHSEAPSNQMPYPLHHVSLLDYSEGICVTYKPNSHFFFFFYSLTIANVIFFIKLFWLLILKLYSSLYLVYLTDHYSLFDHLIVCIYKMCLQIIYLIHM